jgi:hypothetical protein
MSEPIVFPVTTPAMGLPLLVAGQAQKEFFVNQALGLLDALNARAVSASRPTPPSASTEGESYRVTATATGAWTGREDRIAVLIGGDWHFIDPVEGMFLFDRDADRMMMFRSQWQVATAPAMPTGGAVVDAEARAALAGLIHALALIGILGPAAP